MEKKPKKREVGDFEIRVLNDGRLVMLAPDETLIEVAQEIKRQMADAESHGSLNNS